MFAKGWGGITLGIAAFTSSYSHNNSSHIMSKRLIPLPETDSFAIDSLVKVKNTPKETLRHFNQAALTNIAFAEAVAQLDTDLEKFVLRTSSKEGMATEQVWAIVLEWLIERFKDEFTPCRQAQRLLRTQLRTVDAVKKTSVLNGTTMYFSSVTLDAWNTANVKACSA
jgi:hypothetical protein